MESSIQASGRDVENGLNPSPPPAAVSGVCSCWFLPLWQPRNLSSGEQCDSYNAKQKRFGVKTRLLTNDGMLKILCLDVEELLDDTCSNSLNDVFANCKRRSTCP